MAKRNKTAHEGVRIERAATKSKKGAASRADHRPLLVIEKPVWDDRTGRLSWKGQVVLVLAKQAHSERAILSGFQMNNWRWVTKNPLARAAIGDPTQEHRHALYNLKKHQRHKEILRFFSVGGGFVGWSDARWLDQS